MEQQICLFPGQGSEAKGMGATLFPKYPIYVSKANEILGYDIRELCLKNPEGKLQKAQYSLPALFVVNALNYLDHFKDHSRPDILLGHSLGEYNALWAAGVYDFETGLMIVQKLGELLNEVSGGGMAVVIGMTEEEVVRLIDSVLPDIAIANINTYNQFVVAGTSEDIYKAADFFEAKGTAYIPLNVSGAFHSKYISPIYPAFADFLASCHFNAPAIPVISNVTAQPYVYPEIGSLLATHIYQPVLWLQSIEYVLGLGDCTFIETGNQQILTNVIKKIRRDFQPDKMIVL